MTALGDFTAGDVLQASDLNAIGTWDSYTPEIEASGTNPVYNVRVGRYTKINELVVVQFEVGDFTSGGSGTFYAIMPTDIDSSIGEEYPLGYGFAADGTSSRPPIVCAKSSSGARRCFMTYYTGALVTGTTPFTFGANDYIRLTVVYKPT